MLSIRKHLMLYVIVISAMVFSATACGNNNEGHMKGQSYDDDGLLGATSANPNLPTSPTYHNYSADMRLLKDSIRRIPGVRDSTVVLNGPIAYVNLELQDEVDLEESVRIRNHAQRSLQWMMPRYDVKVSVGKNRLLHPGQS